MDVVKVVFSFLLLAILFPVAMTSLTGATTTAWNSSVQTVWNTLLPVIVLVGVAIGFTKISGEL